MVFIHIATVTVDVGKPAKFVPASDVERDEQGQLDEVTLQCSGSRSRPKALIQTTKCDTVPTAHTLGPQSTVNKHPHPANARAMMLFEKQAPVVQVWATTIGSRNRNHR